MPTVSKLMDIARIRTDVGLQSRVELDQNAVEEYAEAMTAGAVFPSPVVYLVDGKDYFASQGFHRIDAYKLVGRAAITVELRTGSFFDAVLDSAAANQDHGVRRTNADKRRAVQMLLDHVESAAWSNSRIADMIGVTPQFVGDVKAPEKRAERNKRAVARQKPQSKSGETVSKSDPADAKTQAELDAENPALGLAADNDRLRDRLAVEAMDATDEEKAMAAETIDTLRRENVSLVAERDAIGSQLNHYMAENAEMKKTIKRLEAKLKKAQG